MNIAFICYFTRWVNYELSIYPTNNYATYRSVKRNIRNRKCCRCTDHCRHFRWTFLINAHDDGNDLNIITEAFWE